MHIGAGGRQAQAEGSGEAVGQGALCPERGPLERPGSSLSPRGSYPSGGVKSSQVLSMMFTASWKKSL